MLLQHQDVNVGPRSYDHLKSDQLLVTSIFYTIQGEGPFAGCPAIFIRLAGCNRGRKDDMGCNFCDTAFHFGKATCVSFEEIKAQMVIAAPTFMDDPRLVVITGGEPMMQNNLVGFVDYLVQDIGVRNVQVESNGDRLVPGWEEAFRSYDPVMLVVSPKTSHKKYPPLPERVFNVVDFLKFVISSDPQSVYYDVPSYAQDAIDSCVQAVYLSPLTVYSMAHEPRVPVSLWFSSIIDRAATRANYKRACEIALKNPQFRISIQQHLLYELE